VMRSCGELLLSNLSTGVAVAEPGAFFTVDVNGDGLDDVLHLGQSAKTFVQFRHAGTAPDLLQSATDGFGVNATFSYAPLSNYALYQRKSTAIYPMQEYSRPLYVVSNVRSSNGVGGTFDLRDFSYEGARVDLQGRGFLGFEYRSWIDSRVGTAQRVTYRQDFPFTGLLSNQKSTQEPSGTVIGEVQLTFAQHAYSSGIETRRLPYVSQSVQYDREAGGAYNGVLVRTTTTINAVDAPSGSVRESVTTLSEGAGANGVNPGQSYTYRTHSPTLFNDFPSWCIGRASTIQQTNSHTLYGGSAQTRTANTTWDAAKCRPTQTVVEPDDPALRVTTEFGYDAFGNLASQTLTAGGIAARVTQLSWGSDGRFPRTLTNPLSQVTTLDWWPALGQLKSATDPNGLVSTSTYDVFGRLTQQTQPDGTSSLVEYLPCDADCTGFTNTRFKIRSTLRDTTLATIAQSFTLFDSLGRPRRSANYALEGGLISQLTEYNAGWWPALPCRIST